MLAYLSFPLMLAAAIASTTDQFQIDQTMSEVSAKVAFFGMFSKTARFPKMTGGISLDPSRPETADLSVTLDASALTAGDGITIKRLKGRDFFDVANHPTVSFSGHGLTMSGPRNATISGTLTARGVSRPSTLSVTFAKPPAEVSGREPIDLVARTTIDRQEFGMKAYSLIVGNKVTITIKVRMDPA